MKPEALETFRHRYLSRSTELIIEDLGLEQLQQNAPAQYIQLAVQLEILRHLQRLELPASAPETFQPTQESVPQLKIAAKSGQSQMFWFTSLTSIMATLIVGVTALTFAWYLGYQTAYRSTNQQAVPPCRSVP